jgi:tetratricopeptide (TPR) repeat protein
MSKKQKRRSVRGGGRRGAPSPDAIERQARADLDAGRYRDAIGHLKELLKLEARADWQAALADAYAGRARELDAKGMLKEALVMWENRAALGVGTSGAMVPDQARLLLRLGRIEPVLAAFAADDRLAAADRDRLRPVLAARLLAGDARIAEGLPDDDPVRRHADAASAALGAYCRGDDAALQQALAAIPYRSPYRDWVQLLKSLQLAPARPAEALALLERIADDSAFAALKRAARLALLPESAFLDAAGKVGKGVLRFACALRGWPPERIVLHDELAQLGTAPNPKALLRLLHRHRADLGPAWARKQSLRLLSQEFPASLKWLAAVGADRTTGDEQRLLTARAAELDGDPWDLHEQWTLYARHLMVQRGAGQAASADDSGRKLRIALALRRCASSTSLLDDEPSPDPEDLDRLLAAQLEASLDWDPDDRNTYLRLIDYYRRGKLLKDARRIQDRAMRRWPRDMQVLGAALDTALGAGSFKKAAGLARQMLEVDPINTDVRERLVAAHLAHARKQVPKGRPDLARKELAQAAEWARGGQAQEQLEITAGLITLLEDRKAGAEALRDLLARLGGGLSAQLVLALAAEGIEIAPSKLLKQIDAPKARLQTQAELLAALSRLRTHLDRGGTVSRDVEAWLAPALKAAPWSSLSRGETETACDTLRRCGLQQARLRLARAALKRWDGAPVFELHAFEAKYPHGFDGRSSLDLYKLEDALERARDEGDTRTAQRIQELLRAESPFGGLPPFPFPSAPPSDLDLDEPGPAELDSIIALIRLIGIERAFELMGLPPELRRELKAMKRQLGEQAMTETLIEFLRRGADFGGAIPDLPFPLPPERGGGKTSRGGGRRRADEDDDDLDDDFGDQLSLF